MTALCPMCHLPDSHGLHAQAINDLFQGCAVCVGAQSSAMETLLQNIADRGTCSGCGAALYWVRHKNGKRVPYTPAGLNHFISCPKAEQFRKKEVKSA